MQQDVNQVVWYIPKGKHTIFSAQKATIKIEDGVLVINNSACVSELARIDLSKSLTKSSFGQVKFKYFEGEKNGLMSGPFCFLYNPKLQLLSLLPMILSIGKARELSKLLNSYSTTGK